MSLINILLSNSKGLSLEKWELFSEYKNLGFDPLRWLPDCSNELKHDSIANELKRNNLRIIVPSYYSYFYYPEKKRRRNN